MEKTPKSRKKAKEDDQYPEFEKTLGLIKPNAASKVGVIEEMIKQKGLLVLYRRRLYLKPEKARDFFLQSLEDEDTKRYYRIYQDLVEASKKEDPDQKAIPAINVMDVDDSSLSSSTEEFVEFMTSGPVEALVIAGRGAVSKWLQLMGPEDPKVARELYPQSIRARFGGDSVLRNAVYGSESLSQAEREIRFFFPDTRFDTECKLGASGEYLSKTVNPILLKGLIQLCRQKPDNPLVWLADWLLANNPNTKS